MQLGFVIRRRGLELHNEGSSPKLVEAHEIIALPYTMHLYVPNGRNDQA